jgi:hypothetical protein
VDHHSVASGPAAAASIKIWALPPASVRHTRAPCNPRQVPVEHDHVAGGEAGLRQGGRAAVAQSLRDPAGQHDVVFGPPAPAWHHCATADMTSVLQPLKRC